MAGTGALVVPVLAAGEGVPPTLIVFLWLSCGLVAAVLVVAALMLSSRISQEEGVEQPIGDPLDTEHLQRFPHGR